ncbi:TRAP transporter substrate-binding protein [Pararhodobacter zhoushanensis]|uniref:TRAP transporter substrate-binding protein n=1 Tax=Pararhodobacter zhoushanensis TaxID=2479545 RepID=A0ABT3GXP2_9RHOB|nr:TRAP transporter substrate-binding protein [Pararhodobacter zhoushanensis]MCW1932296.1 TRAP transporter substrate-binding protein [Pararhodobacter zhoushanensis]
MLTGISTRAAVLATALGFAAVPAGAETLKLAHFVPTTHILTASVVEPFVNAVSAATNGDLQIQVFPSGELGAGPGEQYVRALNGIADIVWSVTGYTSTQFERTMIAELPGVFDGQNGAEVLHGALADHLAVEFPGTHPLALWTAEPNILIMRNREIRSPEDLRGLRIRVAGAFPAMIVEALGGTAVQMPAAEGYNALQNGLIDGTLTGASAVADFRFGEVADYFILGPDLGHVGFYLTMSQASYDALSPEHQAAIDDASGLALANSGEAGWNAHADETIAALRADPNENVIDLRPEEIAAFDAITVQLRDDVVAEMDGRGIDASATLAAMQSASQ